MGSELDPNSLALLLWAVRQQKRFGNVMDTCQLKGVGWTCDVCVGSILDGGDGLGKTWTAVMAEGGESPEVTRLWDPL